MTTTTAAKSYTVRRYFNGEYSTDASNHRTLAAALDFDDSSHRADLPTGIAARDVDAVNELVAAMNRRQNLPALAAMIAPRSLADAFPRGVTLDAAAVDVLVGELDATLRRAGGAR